MLKDFLDAQGLGDPSWILELDEFDEPPLFTRFDQADFMAPLEPAQRFSMIMRLCVSVLEQFAELLSSRETDRLYLIFVTFGEVGFEIWREGDSMVPSPSFYVDPEYGDLPIVDASIFEPYTENGKAVQSWLSGLGEAALERYCVGEDPPDSYGRVHGYSRVYLGWRTDPCVNIRSVGRMIDWGVLPPKKAPPK